jgi:hypothetical protein
MIEEYLFALNDMDQERKILTVFCYYPEPVTDGLSRPRIMSLSDKLNMPWFIDKEWDAEAGNMLVSGKARGLYSPQS